MAMSRGKVETISRLARWRIGGVDSLGPWPATVPWSEIWSDSFKIGISEWTLGIGRQKDNQQVFILLMLKPSPASVLKEQPVVANVVFRTFDMESNNDSPEETKPYEGEIKPNQSIHYTIGAPHGSFIVDVEFFDLKISPLSVGEQPLSIWPGLMPSLSTKTTLPCLSRMLVEGIHTDVTINTPGGVLKAHKAVLSASSPVFESMFLHDLKEKETSTINIEDMSLESCVALLSCMYGNIKQEEFFEQRLELLAAADKYGMTDLKNCCEDSLLIDVDFSNVLERLQEALIYRLDKLKKVCFKYLFEFGMVYKVNDEMNSFIQHADRDLIKEMFQELTTAQKLIRI